MAALVVAAISTAAVATPVVRKGYMRGGQTMPPCAVRVDFGSSASGPDIAAWSVIQAYVLRSAEIDEADAWGWGREVEFSVCLTTHDKAAAHKVLADLTALVPAVPATNGGWTKLHAGPAK